MFLEAAVVEKAAAVSTEVSLGTFPYTSQEDPMYLYIRIASRH